MQLESIHSGVIFVIERQLSPLNRDSIQSKVSSVFLKFMNSSKMFLTISRSLSSRFAFSSSSTGGGGWSRLGVCGLEDSRLVGRLPVTGVVRIGGGAGCTISWRKGVRSSGDKAENLLLLLFINLGGRTRLSGLGSPWLIGPLFHGPPWGPRSKPVGPDCSPGGFFMAAANRLDLFDWTVLQSPFFCWGGCRDIGWGGGRFWSCRFSSCSWRTASRRTSSIFLGPVVSRRGFQSFSRNSYTSWKTKEFNKVISRHVLIIDALCSVHDYWLTLTNKANLILDDNLLLELRSFKFAKVLSMYFGSGINFGASPLLMDSRPLASLSAKFCSNRWPTVESNLQRHSKLSSSCVATKQ